MRRGSFLFEQRFQFLPSFSWVSSQLYGLFASSSGSCINSTCRAKHDLEQSGLTATTNDTPGVLRNELSCRYKYTTYILDRVFMGLILGLLENIMQLVLAARGLSSFRNHQIGKSRVLSGFP